MNKALKIALALIVGFVTWFAVATLGNFVLRAVVSDYRVQELAMSFSFAAMFGRLVIGAVSTAAACAVAVLIERRNVAMGVIAGCVLLAFFIPVHASLWSKFPLWYHLIFLGSLPLIGLITGRSMAVNRK